jgi:hypothetical protein
MALTIVRRARARLDRLPSGARLTLLGVVVQFVVAGGLVGRAFTAGSETQLLVTGLLLGITLAATVACVPIMLLLRSGRLPRAAALLAAGVAAGMLIIVEMNAVGWILPAALLVTAVRTAGTAGLGVTDLLQLDPSRFERVDPSERGSGGQATASSQSDDTDGE